ncbi:hypothetical protein [Aquicella lusitana]|uniref:DUF2157 domain-containing protein n=1 Tax=Aquicella lusitana TaxID=254246 RepID=A0A370GPY4_9COXI|nr:hypothetical protein [Aquicella lusitana]RDI44544.1 hypothetical protein C8D86_10926 [Aquicella lusitana]VVC72514.1 hypothetical protein AQULUS_02260 [Aquicella lusitana]
MNNPASKDAASSKNVAILRIFNYLGGALVFFGIAFFVSVNWYALNDFIRIFATLGAALAAYLVAVLFHLARYEAASTAFFLITGLTLPIGIYVTFKITGMPPSHLLSAIISGLSFCLFLFTYFFLPRTLLLLLSIVFASAFFNDLLYFLVEKSNFIFSDLMEYELIVLGLSYMLLGYYLDRDNRHPLTGLLYFFGSLFILSGSYTLGGFFFYEQGLLAWRILTPILIFSSFLFSVALQSKALLYVGALFTVIYIIDLSTWFARIFSSFSWPLILIFLGFAFMLIGYLVFYLHIHFFGRKSD